MIGFAGPVCELGKSLLPCEHKRTNFMSEKKLALSLSRRNPVSVNRQRRSLASLCVQLACSIMAQGSRKKNTMYVFTH